MKFFRGEYLRNRYTLTIQNMYIYRGLTDIFVRVIPARSREMAAKSDVPAKVRWCNRHKYYLKNPLRRILLGSVSFGRYYAGYTAFGSRIFFEMRVNFGWL